MNSKDFVKCVYKMVWGPNTKVKHWMMDEFIDGMYTYEETLDKIKLGLNALNKTHNNMYGYPVDK